MKRNISVFLIAVLLIFGLAGCKNEQKSSSDSLKLKSGETFVVKVSMEDSGLIKSMALTIYSDDNTFEIVGGNWLNHNAVIADFNMENKDAAIAFKEETNYCGEIFEFEVKTKKDITVIDDMFDVDTVLKKEQETVTCKGVTLSYSK